jgi:hypothetical protein
MPRENVLRAKNMLTEKDIISAALNLPIESHALIIDNILESLMTAEREETDALRAQEAEERIRAYERGEIVSVPGEQVFQNAHTATGLSGLSFFRKCPGHSSRFFYRTGLITAVCAVAVSALLLCICAATLYTGAISYSLRNWFIARIFSLGVPGTIPSLLAI